MKTKRIILFLAAAALFTGCFKDVSYKTTYVFKPLEQEKSGDPTQILADAKLYAFAADTSSWEVASYKGSPAASGVEIFSLRLPRCEITPASASL